MLTELAIKKFAVIQDAQISFGKGLSVLTGETGAGKSMIIQAVNLLLGARASADLIRTGEDTAELDACFDIEEGSAVAAIMEEQGMDTSCGLIITRQISSSGKSRVFVNSRPATLDLLKSITANLAVIAGQHSHQTLLKEEHHLDILDNFAGTTQARQHLEKLYREIMPLKKQIQEMEETRSQRIQEAELLQFQADELAAAAIVPEEDENLALQKKQLTHALGIFETISRTINEIHDTEGSVSEKLSALHQNLANHQEIFPDIQPVCERFHSVIWELDDITATLRDIAGDIDLDPQSLETINERLDILAKLKRKYGGDLEFLLEKQREFEETLANTRNMDEDMEQMKNRVKDLEGKIAASASALSSKRKSAAKTLSSLAREELGALEMDKASFEVAFSTVPATSDQELSMETGEKIMASGMDKVVFMLAPNPGEAPRPLHRIASGGELSRIILALKAVLSRSQALETLIFDEVDAGIGGATAEKVGKKLQELSCRQQVICITHQAQIAKYGDNQFFITKKVADGRTATTILPLTDTEDRVRELARMIGGTDISDTTLAHAREMLTQAQAPT